MTPAGKAIGWLRDHASHQGDDCLIWPFSRDPNGYGRIGGGRVNGKKKMLWTHRLMCEWTNGPPPSSDHEATHSCGNGKLGCVNPQHLDWGTRTKNQLDRRLHGTKAIGGYRGERKKLTPEKVRAIRSLRGTKPQREIAGQFGVTDATIRDIYTGKSWRALA